MLLWADEQPVQGALHVGIKLGAGGEQIGLHQVNGTAINALDFLTFEAQTADISSGREQDGAATFVSFTTPTPKASNNSTAPTTYTLTTTASPGAGGTVGRSPNATSYASGTVVSLTATPAAGYTFTGWSGDATGTVNPLSVTMSANKSITATFTPTGGGQQVVSFMLINAATDQPIRELVAGEVLNLATLGTSLNVQAITSPGTVGSVRFVLSGAQSATKTETGQPYALFGDNNGNYASWTPPVGSYSLTATPYTGSNAGGTAGTPLTLAFSVVNQSTPPTTYTLTTTASPGAGGTVGRSPNATSYASGSVVSLTATPAAGYTFTGWSGDATGTTNPLSVTMSANKSITATFTQTPPTTYTLTTTASPTVGGSIGRSPNATSYASGTVVSLTATPAAGYTFTGWSGDATGTTNPLAVTMSANKSITATFTATGGGQQVVSFILINAATDQPIRQLVNGETLNLATLGTSLNVQALTNPATVGSVRFVLTGPQTQSVTKTETGAPYALFGDTNGNYASWNPPLGNYSLTGTPYTKGNAGGQRAHP
ncbi:hypothetical protein G7064_05245 [Hymenobacter sp. HDW8]|nr:hypothetical protein G7064_05245 [Hymenobacter sp. HDW8]